MNSLPIHTYLQNGKYRIEGVLGQGGFGITYRASMKIQIQGPLGMMDGTIQVAIKEFFMKDLCNRDSSTSHVSAPSAGSRQLIERFRKKFIKEANHIAMLQHKNIVKVIDVFEENETAYYVMEYIEGCSLQEWIKKYGAMQEIDALACIRQVAAALAYIHQHKINHLDVKPANILYKPDASTVLIDFGLAKQYDEKGDQTSSTPIGVSAGYAPIEQSKPGGVGQFSAPTDIYALGATLFKLVTGQTPPDASDILNDGFPALPSSISAPTAYAIESAMQPSRGKRPQTISSFLSLLNENLPQGNTFHEDALSSEETRLLQKEEAAPQVAPAENEKKADTHLLEVKIETEGDKESILDNGLSKWKQKKTIFSIGILGNIGWWLGTGVAILFLFPYVLGYDQWEEITNDISLTLGFGDHFWGQSSDISFFVLGLCGLVIILLGFFNSLSFFPRTTIHKIRYSTTILVLFILFLIWGNLFYYSTWGGIYLLLFSSICFLMGLVCFFHRHSYSLASPTSKTSFAGIEALAYPCIFLLLSRSFFYWNGNISVTLLAVLCLLLISFRIQQIWKKLPTLLTSLSSPQR